MRSIFFYTAVIGFASGVLFRSFFIVPKTGYTLILLVACAALILFMKRKGGYRSSLFLLSLFLLAACCGSARYHMVDSASSPLHTLVDTRIVREGFVAQEPDYRDTSVHLYIRDEETGALFLAFGDPYLDVAYGDTVRVMGELSLPESFESETGRVFNYPGYLKARGVHEVVYRAQVEVLGTGGGNTVIRRLIDVKHTFMEVIERSLPEPGAGLGEGVLLGVKRAIGPELEEVFRTVGIIHIVVLSGYNIMIVAEWTMRFFGLFFFPRTRLLFGLTMVALFALMVGLSATVVRASIMAGLGLIARSLGRPHVIVRALALTGVAMLIHNPYLLAFDPGFELSFLATLGLILLSPELEARFTRVPLVMRGVLATTVGTQLFVLPLLLFSMGTFSLVGVIVNVLVVPLVPFAMFLTFLTALIGTLVPMLGVGIGFIASMVLTYIVNIAYLFAGLPFASVEVPPFPWWGMTLMFSFILWFTYSLMKRKELNESTTMSINRHSGEDVSNEYKDWVIEEVKEK